MELRITKVFRSDKDKAGNPLVFKTGKAVGQPYSKIAVKTVEYGDKWISGFDAPWNQSWAENQTVEADVEQNGEYLNLKRADPLQAILARLAAIEKDIETLKTYMKQ